MRVFYFLMSVGLSCQSYNDRTKYYGRYPDLSTSAKLPTTTVPITVPSTVPTTAPTTAPTTVSQVPHVPYVPNIVCDGSWYSPFEFKLSPGKNGRSEYVSQVLGNMFYGFSDGEIAVIQPIAEYYFDIQSENGQMMIRNKWNGEKITCGTFKTFILERFDRIQYDHIHGKDQNDFWNIGRWMEKWTYTLPGYNSIDIQHNRRFRFG